VFVLNGGWRGATSTDIASAGVYSLQGFASSVPPAASIISVGINDIRTGGANNSVATIQASVNTIAGWLGAAGDIMYAQPSPIAPAQDAGTGAHMADVLAMYVTLAGSAYNLSRTPDVTGNYAALNTAGFMNADGLHIRNRNVARKIGYARADMLYAAALMGGYGY
jgi:hypothetical protein